MLAASHAMPLTLRILTDGFELVGEACARPTYPIAFASLSTPTATRPSDVSWRTFEDCVWPPSTDDWKNVYWPADELRPIGSIVVDRCEPLTWPQLLSTPRKTFFSVVSEMLL